MKNVYWFKDQRFFDYSGEEEYASLRHQFSVRDNIFLLATKNNEHKGVIGIRVNQNRGTIRRWEPATIKPDDFDTGDALLERALKEAIERGLSKLSTVIRYPYESVQPWLCRLYRAHGFRDPKPGVQLIMSLKDDPTSSTSIETVSADNYSIIQLRDLVLESFASQPEDILVHGGDVNVVDPVMVERQLELIRAGAFGETNEQLMRVAELDGEPVGFIMGAIREETNRPRYGVITILGVSPEYRKKGLGSGLSSLIISRFNERKCEYAYIGTPRNNQKAIRIYEELGFRPIFNINFYEKTLV